MKNLFILFILMSVSLFSSENWSEISKMDRETAEWLRTILSEKLPQKSEIDQENFIEGKQCHKAFFTLEEKPQIYIFLSFSVPENIWIQLSSEFAKRKALFVIRGLPKNSFSDFSKKMIHLKKIGLDVSVSIDPSLFEKFAIEKVPAFVMEKADGFDKIYGSISPNFVLERFEKK